MVWTSNTPYTPVEQQIRDLARAYRDLAAAGASLIGSGAMPLETSGLARTRLEILNRISELLGPADEGAEADDAD